MNKNYTTAVKLQQLSLVVLACIQLGMCSVPIKYWEENVGFGLFTASIFILLVVTTVVRIVVDKDKV